jgi:hypothetical protein
MKAHELKTLPGFFEAVLSGEKTFEARKNDRMFQKGDQLWLREYDYKKDTIGSFDSNWPKGYSGRSFNVEITHVLTGEEWGIKDGYAMLSFKKLDVKG